MDDGELGKDNGFYPSTNPLSTIPGYSGNISGNSSTDNTSIASSSRNELLAKVEISVLAVILHLALFGNIVVISILLYKKGKLTRMQLFIIHLALADIAVALCQVLPQLIMDITYRFDGNNFLCKLVKYVQVLTMYSSTYVLIVTALDRYVSICHPLTSQTWTSRRVNVMVLLAWVLSALFSIPQLILFSYKKRYDGVYDCLDNFDFENSPWKPKTYITWIFVSVYLVPFVILTGCYSKICYIVWISVNSKENPQRMMKKKSKRLSSRKSDSNNDKDGSSEKTFRTPRAHSKRLSRSKIKTIKLTLTVIICFLVCWAPFFITQMWSAFDDNAPYYTSHVMAIATLLAGLNSCTNPWIYLAFSGRLCKREKREITKTWTSTAHTFMNENSEISRGRSSMHTEAIALTSRISRKRDSPRLKYDNM